MLRAAHYQPKTFKEYRDVISDTLFVETLGAAKVMAGKRVLQINSTDTGGGVAEILHSEAPLLKELGLNSEWQVVDPPEEFFEVSKQIHNGLQGSNRQLKSQEWKLYDYYNRLFAAEINANDWDVIVVHDPQPAAIIHHVKRGKAKWIWRCHIDSRHALPQFRHRMEESLRLFDGAIFTMAKYVLDGLSSSQVGIIPVAIDPLSPKNLLMDKKEAQAIIKRFGLDPHRPLVVQVSRFDVWKDPLGVLQAWEIARQQVPGLQLALVGDSAPDDPESGRVLAEVQKLATGQEDAVIVANQADDRAVKAFYVAADVVLQKSLREGFGLTVSEALWSGTPVVGSDIGGIPLQVENGKSGYLVDNPDQAARRTVELINDPRLAEAMGEYGREQVRDKFLLPRLIRDDLRFWAEIIA